MCAHSAKHGSRKYQRSSPEERLVEQCGRAKRITEGGKRIVATRRRLKTAPCAEYAALQRMPHDYFFVTVALAIIVRTPTASMSILKRWKVHFSVKRAELFEQVEVVA